MIPLLVTLLACGGHSDEAPPSEPSLQGRVDWDAASAASRVPLATLPAEVVAAPGGALALHPGVSGQLLGWRVEVGERVVAGQPLAEVASAEWGNLAARAERSAAAARAEGERVGSVRAAAEAGVLTRQEVAGAEVSQASLEAEARGLAASLAGGSLRPLGGGRALWISPSDGLIQAVDCLLGALPAPEQPCVRLVRPELARVVVRVPERLGGLPAETQADWVGADGRRAVPLALLIQSPAIDPSTRSRVAWFEAAGAGAIGASGRATLAAPAPAGAVRVPTAALTHIDGAAVVFTRAGPTPVTVLGRDADGFVVTGVAEGVEIAVRGVTLLKSLALLAEEEA